MNLQGKRWFIWTIVLAIAAGVGLTTWIMYSSVDQGDSSTWLTLHHSVAASKTTTTTTAKTKTR